MQCCVMRRGLWRTHQITGQDLLPVVAVVVAVVDEVQVCVGKVQQAVGVVDGEAVGPVQLGAHDAETQLSVHAGSLDGRVPAPVRPEHEVGTAVRRARSVHLHSAFKDNR